MTIDLSEDRRNQLLLRIRGFHLEQFEEELTPFRAEHLLDFFLTELGPPIYNQAIQDARGWMLRKLEDLEGDVAAV